MGYITDYQTAIRYFREIVSEMSLKALFLVVVSLGGLGVSSSPTPRDTNNTTSSPYRAPGMSSDLVLLLTES